MRLPFAYRAAGIAVLTTVVQAWFVTPGLEWLSDDYASYIHNAQSLIRGTPYDMPGYVADLLVDAGPGAYPPGYPALLAPGVAIFGTDLVALRVYNLVFAAALTLLFMLWLRPVAGLPCTFAVGALVGLCPFIAANKELIGSEFACYALLMLWLLVDRGFGDTRPGIRGSVLTALPLAAAVLTRIAVAAAIGARPLADIWRRRRIVVSDVVGPVVTVVLIGAGLLLITPHIIEHYIANITVNMNDQTGAGARGIGVIPVLVRDNLTSLLGQISVVWSAGPLGDQPSFHLLNLARKAATLLIVLAGMAGLATCFYRGPRTADMFFVLQLGALLVLPSKMTSPRLYGMLSLLVIYYAFVLAGRFRLHRPLSAAVVALLLAGTVPSWIGMAATPPDRFTVYEPRAQEFLQFLRTATPPDAVILTRKARAVTLFTGRGSSDWHEARADAGFMARAARLHANYIVFYTDQPDTRQLDKARGGDDSDASLNRSMDQLIAAFFAADPAGFEQVFANGRFRVFRFATPR